MIHQRGFAHIRPSDQGIKTPIILVINKTDTVKNQEDILTFINAYKDICDFAEIVPVSALRDKNTYTLLEQLFKYLPWGISSSSRRRAFSRISSAAIWRIGCSVTVSSS